MCGNTVGSFTCRCNQGYTLDETGTTCLGKLDMKIKFFPFVNVAIKYLPAVLYFKMFDIITNTFFFVDYTCIYICFLRNE